MTDNPIRKNASGSPVDPQDILRYAAGEMTDAEARELEARSLEDPFLSDAMEGMEGSGDRIRMENMAYALNRDLKKRLSKKQKRNRWIGFESPAWWPWMILILLMLITLAYLLIQKISG